MKANEDSRGRSGWISRPYGRAWLAMALWLVGAGIRVGFAATVHPAVGDATAESTIRKTIDDAFAVLKDKGLAGKDMRTQRIAALRTITDRSFDWPEMARGSLGAASRTLKGDQRAQFVEVFKSILSQQYMEDIDRFQGTETVAIEGSEPEGDDVVVRTTLVTSSRERVPMDYRMRVVSGRWLVVDLSIEGISMVNHFRKTFSQALTNMTISELIDRLKRQIPAAER